MTQKKDKKDKKKTFLGHKRDNTKEQKKQTLPIKINNIEAFKKVEGIIFLLYEKKRSYQ